MMQVLSVCTDILKIQFTFLGFKVSLFAFLLFEIVAYLLIWVVFKLFSS